MYEIETDQKLRQIKSGEFRSFAGRFVPLRPLRLGRHRHCAWTMG